MILQAEALHIPLADESVQCAISSPPYWGLRSYLDASHKDKNKEIGLESTPEEYVEKLVAVFREVKRVLRRDGVCWVNLGDSYAANGVSGRDIGYSERTGRGEIVRQNREKYCPPGLKPKDLVGIPWRVAFALQADGWWLRSAIPWLKRNSMPESVEDRPATALEYIFLLAKSERYFFDMEAIKISAVNSRMRGPALHPCPDTNGNGGLSRRPIESARHRRNSDWWFESWQGLYHEAGEMLGFVVNAQAFSGSHFATFPEALVKPCVLAGTSEKGCCLECGKPWERVVEKTSVTPIDYEGKYLNTDPNSAGRRILANARARRESGEDHDNPFPSAKTLYWQPACKHNAATKPCVVLDPFGGSMTVVKVAQDLGRVGIGLDISWDYLQMGKRRAAQWGLGI